MSTPRASQNQNGKGAGMEARDIWFSYDGKSQILRGVDLTVQRGLMTMILGRSGSGKTTFLKVLEGLLVPQRGSVRLLAAGQENGSKPRRNRVAYVPQTLGLVRNMTALENALAGALGRTGTVRTLLRSFPKGIVEEARATLTSLGLGHKMDDQVFSLSGGERQRVAIARALMQQPALILADEFVSQLDPITAEEILEMMRRIAAGGVGFLITTHETDVVAHHADRVVVMRQGVISHDGPGRNLSMDDMLELLR
jgi:phosphonate transport system ATP-binding protein